MFPVKIPYPPNSTHQLPLNWFYQYQLVVSFPCMSPGHIDTTGTPHKIKNYNAKSYSIWNPYRGIDKLSNFPGGIKRLVFQGVFSNFSDLQGNPCGVTVRRQNLIENYAGKCHAKRRTVWRTSKVVLQGAIKKFSRAGDLNLNQITGGPQKKYFQKLHFLPSFAFRIDFLPIGCSWYLSLTHYRICLNSQFENFI